jgi:hypothetical protein
MDDTDSDGFGAGADRSKGDPRVVLALNAVLSTVFAFTIVWGLDLIGAMEYTLVNVATVAVLLFAVAYAVAS